MFQREVYETQVKVAQLKEQLAQNKSPSFVQTFDLLKKYEQVSASIINLRGLLSAHNPTLLRLEENLSEFSLYFLNSQKEKKIKESFYTQYRKLWRLHLHSFYFCLILFALSSIMGFSLVWVDARLTLTFLPENFYQTIMNHEAWFKRLQGEEIFGAFSIALNNIAVCIKTFFGGALLGLGGLVFLIYNGLFFGAVFGFCVHNNFGSALGEFVIAHGVLEISIIIASCFASLVFGRVFFQRPYKNFSKNLSQASQEAFTLILGIVPWLILAGTVEGIVSPQDSISIYTKILISLSIATAFWLWSFWPIKA